MKHKKEHHKEEKKEGHSKMAKIEPMAKGGGPLKSVKKGHKSVSGK